MLTQTGKPTMQYYSFHHAQHSTFHKYWRDECFAPGQSTSEARGFMVNLTSGLNRLNSKSWVWVPAPIPEWLPPLSWQNQGIRLYGPSSLTSCWCDRMWEMPMRIIATCYLASNMATFQVSTVWSQFTTFRQDHHGGWCALPLPVIQTFVVTGQTLDFCSAGQNSGQDGQGEVPSDTTNLFSWISRNGEQKIELLHEAWKYLVLIMLISEWLYPVSLCVQSRACSFWHGKSEGWQWEKLPGEWSPPSSLIIPFLCKYHIGCFKPGGHESFLLHSWAIHWC